MIIAPAVEVESTACPWDAAPHTHAEWEIRDCQAWQLWLTTADAPRADELLASRGFDPVTTAAWIDGGHRMDTLHARALAEGSAVGRLSDAGLTIDGVGAKAYAAAVVQAEATARRLYWRLIAARADRPFTSSEVHALGARLRLWQFAFNRPAEPDLMRILVGAGDRLIHADPGCELTLLSRSIAPAAVVTRIAQIRAQRWPDARDGAVCDMAVDLAGEPWHVRALRRRAAPADAAAHWLIELRRLEPGEMRAVGLLDDDRIARAVGYIHNRYHEGPSLTVIAREAGMSPFHFHRVFSRLVGASPKQYLLQKQIQAARWMLRSGALPVGQVAREAGFSSHGHFTTTFRRVVGASPTEYRFRAGGRGLAATGGLVGRTG